MSGSKAISMDAKFVSQSRSSASKFSTPR